MFHLFDTVKNRTLSKCIKNHHCLKNICSLFYRQNIKFQCYQTPSPIIFSLNTIKTQKYFIHNVYKWSVAKMATTTSLLIFLLQKLFAQDICQCWLSVGQHLMFMNYGPTICQMQKCIFCANGHIRMDQSSRKCLKQSEMQTNG